MARTFIKKPAVIGQKLVFLMLRNVNITKRTSELIYSIDASRFGIRARVEGRKKMKNWVMKASHTRMGAFTSSYLYSLFPILALHNPAVRPSTTARRRIIPLA